MGASTSFANNLYLTNQLFISFPEKDKKKSETESESESESEIEIDLESNYNIEKLKNKLKTLNFSFLDSGLTQKSIIANSVFSVNNNIKSVLDKIPYFFICLTSKTPYSISQNIEFNSIFSEREKEIEYEKKIYYLILEKDFTPINNIQSKCIVGNHDWLLFYDSDTVDISLNLIITYLINDFNEN